MSLRKKPRWSADTDDGLHSKLRLEDLSQELLISILRHLDQAADLARVGLLNSHFYKLASDEHVWRSLFQAHFPAARRLPSQQSWKALYRLNLNWTHGRASPMRLSLRSQVLAPPPASLDIDATPLAKSEADEEPIGTLSQEERPHSTLVQFSGQYIFTASRTADPNNPIPSVSVEQMRPDGTSLALGNIYSSALIQYYADRPHLVGPRFALSVVELQLDEAHAYASDTLRLAVVYSSGQFALFQIRLAAEEFAVIEQYSKLETTQDPIVMARYHCPVLVTCTRNFVLRFHLIKKRDDVFQVVESGTAFQTQLAWHPSVLTLKRTGKYRFRASFVYSTPFYSLPSSWTLGLQEFFLNLPKDGSETDEPLSIETHSATCIPSPNYAHPTPLISSIQHSGQYIVSSRLDNTIDLHEVLPALSGRRPLTLLYRKTLFGHTTSVNSISLRGERCVSAGKDGKLRLWNFGQRPMDRGIEVTENSSAAAGSSAARGASSPHSWSADASPAHEASSQSQGIEWVSFDEEKIVVVEAPSPLKPLKVLSFV